MKSYTDLEQSKKLEKILQLESADLYYDIGFDKDYHIKMPTNGYFGNKRFFIQFPEAVPCWSLVALLSVLPKGTNISTPKPVNELGYCCWNQYDEIYASNPIDACYEMVIKLHELKML